MDKKLIALPAGKATGLPAYRCGAALAVEVLDRIRAQARTGEAVTPYWLADDVAVCHKLSQLMAQIDQQGGAA